jgi:hypothetical protein
MPILSQRTAADAAFRNIRNQARPCSDEGSLLANIRTLISSPETCFSVHSFSVIGTDRPIKQSRPAIRYHFATQSRLPAWYHSRPNLPAIRTHFHSFLVSLRIEYFSTRGSLTLIKVGFLLFRRSIGYVLSSRMGLGWSGLWRYMSTAQRKCKFSSAIRSPMKAPCS